VDFSQALDALNVDQLHYFHYSYVSKFSDIQYTLFTIPKVFLFIQPK
jgi:hypothetical protein